ncbi:MAG: alpha/beta hydrolase [Burkholderiales bacterium]
MTAAANYNPAAKFEIKVSDIEFRKTATRTLMARVYQPQGAGPFPVLLDLHGGAWNNKDRLANAPMDEAVAKSGVLVVAIDMSLAPEAPYPACIQEASYGIRWLKAKAAEWNGDAHTLGILGSSSGGHVAQLLGMCPFNAVYNKHDLPVAPNIDTVVAYVATRSPISDPFARFQQAEKMKRDHMIKNSKIFFNPWETIFEGNPQKMLDRREKVELLPMLIMQGGLDDNVIPAIQEKFSASYRAAGGECQYELYEGCTHEWVATPGPQTDRAHEMLKAFISKQLKAGRQAS